KTRQPDIPIVWGGWHPSLFPTKTLQDEASIDITIQGQGEQTFIELVERLANGGNLQGLQGTTFRTHGEIV
ncbi:MAG: B12-binding domain-containing radical SAM protein, partial [Calditrichae bacterium]|nr:B12-binding domain-containing radical SAM protein [Calditrichia bacterium]